MMSIFTGQRPDITPAQIVSGVPILAELLHSFGIYDLSVAQQNSLAHAATWALALVAGDTILRVGRGVSAARVQSAGVMAGAGGMPTPPAMSPNPNPPTDEPLPHEENLPTDAEEFASPPPGSPPVQPLPPPGTSVA